VRDNSVHFDHIGLNVADLEAQATWYERALGLTRTLPFSVPPIELTGLFLIDGNGFALELIHRPGSVAGMDAANPGEAALTRGYGHFCLRVDDVDTFFERLVAAGAEVAISPQESPEPGVRFAYVRDPEGNLIEFHDRKHPVR
jgi:catechol 2,3-dioxygenase-like lactoylglutathione lyase family enzyme